MSRELERRLRALETTLRVDRARYTVSDRVADDEDPRTDADSLPMTEIEWQARYCAGAFHPGPRSPAQPDLRTL
jgi:hypothetical protein